jgi:uncharacterized delta-60 repeat protein
MKHIFSLVLLFAAFTVSSRSLAAQACPNAPGCLDPSFNGSGTLAVTLPGGAGGLRDSVLQSDGKIIGLVDSSATEIMLTRVNTDGTLDTSFGTDGFVKTNWHYNSTLPRGFPFSLAIQRFPDTSEFIIVAGSWTVQTGRNTSVEYLRVERYKLDGQIDTSFANGGTALVNKPYALAVAVQPDDQKIVTVGDLEAVVRLNANGTVDTSFGPKGDGATGAGQPGMSILALPQNKGGGILIGGTYTSQNNSLMCVSKLKSTGAVETTFGTGGRAVADFYGRGSFGRAFEITLDPYGNILAGGIARRKGDSLVQNKYAAARFTSSGQLDTSFSLDGKLTYDFFGLDNNGHGIAAQYDGKVILTGTAQTATNVRNFASVRFNYDGTLDTGFGTSGTVTTDLGGNSEYVYGAQIWMDPGCACEKLVVGGLTGNPTVSAPAFLRYTTTIFY